MAKKKKAAKKRKAAPRVPRKVVITQSRTTTIGKPKSRKTSKQLISQAKDLLYAEMAYKFIKLEKASKKSDKRKIRKDISETRRKINKLK